MKFNTDKYKEIIIPLFTKYVPNAKIILYGSRARGDASQGSDIDIALDAGSKIDENKLSALINAIDESDLPINFDIVDLYCVSERMKKEILKDGIVWKK